MMYPNHVLAQAPVNGGVNEVETFTIVVVGFFFVLAVLAILAAVTATMGTCFKRADERIVRKAAEAHALAKKHEHVNTSAAVSHAGGSAASADETLDPAIVAVITAAVHTVMGQRAHRLVSIRPGGPGWAQEGRRQIFSSHRIR